MNLQPVALLGEAPPRILVKPKNVKANSWEDVADLAQMCGITLDQWQELILESTLGELRNGTWAAKRVGISVPRQNGKSHLLVVRALAGALLLGEKKIIISAHQQDTARESFDKLVEIIEDDNNQWLRDRLDKKFGRGGIMNALMREAVKFSNGAKIQFKARSGAAGKGFSADCLLLDEAQILGSRAWTSINSTMSARKNPQVWLLGTPPQDEDDCFTFDMVRRAATEGKSTASAWLEWSADPNAEDFDPESEFTRWSANPAWNTRINHDVVQGEFETYTPERFMQDRLGIWREDVGEESAIPATAWADRALGVVPEDWPLAAVGIDMNPERTAITLAVAAWSPDGVHVELVDSTEADERFDEMLSEQIVAWLWKRCHRRIPVVLDAYTPARSLEPLLKKRKMMVRVLGAGELAQACGGFYDAVVKDKTLSHFDQPQLNASIGGAVKDPFGKSGAWKWNRKSFEIDLTPTMAATCAWFGATKFGRRRAAKSSGEVEVDVL